MIEYIFVNFFDALIKCSSSIYSPLDIQLVLLCISFSQDKTAKKAL